MGEKEREVQLLRKQLQVRELDLARLKLTSLREAPIQSGISETVSQPTAAVDDYAGKLSFKSTEHPLVESIITLTRGDIFTSQGISGDGIPTCLVKESDEKVTVPKITSHPSITKVTTLQVPSEQQGLMTTTADLLTSEHVAAPTSNLLKSQHVYVPTSNPFQRDGNVTEPTQFAVSLAQSSVTNRVPYGSQTQLGNFEGTQSLKEINKQGLTSQIQSTQQVTKLSTSLSDTLFTSRLISSVGTVNHGKLTAEGQTYSSHRGKAPPIDSFTAEDIRITFDDWLPILE